MRSSKIRDLLLLLFFALSFYRLGAANIEGFLNYPFWLDMGRMMANADFAQLRVEHMWKIFPLMVAPIGLLFIVTGALAFTGAPPVPRWIFLWSVILQLVALVSTLLIQLPIQMQLTSVGYDPAAIERLIWTDTLFRKVPSFAQSILVVVALWRVIASRRSEPATQRG